MLGIVDYGMGNLRSVQKSFERMGVDAQVLRHAEELRRADHLVVPGVGAFADAIATLRRSHLDLAITDFINSGKPVLGICLGLQLLMEVGHEDGEHRGLGVIRGDCVRFTVDATPLRLKVPHMGWNALDLNGRCPLFNNVPAGSYAYFVHCYHVRPADEAVIACRTNYGGPFVSAIWRDNLMATQFHPEKSQAVGAAMLQNFASF